MDIPTKAEVHTPEGAAAFVAFFMDVVSSSWTKPEDGLIPQLSEPGCLACKSFESTARGLVTRGQRYRTRPSTTISVTPEEGYERQAVHLVLQQHTVDVLDAEGRAVSTDQSKRFSVRVELTWRQGRWWLFDMG